MPVRFSRSVSTLVGTALGGAGAIFVVLRIGDSWKTIVAAAANPDPSWLLLAGLVALASMTGIGLGWAQVLKMFRVEVPARTTLS